MSLQGLADSIDELDVVADPASMKELLALRDRFEAKVSASLAAFDADAAWAFDGASSLPGWLRVEARCSDRDAYRLVDTARKLAQLPAVRDAWRDNVLSGGQVDVILQAVTRKTLPVFAQHDAAIVDALTGVGMVETKGAMRRLAAAADDAVNDGSEGSDRERCASKVHLSQTMGGRWKLNGDLDAETGELLDTALRLAASNDPDPEVSMAKRLGGATGTVAKSFLDNHDRDDLPAPRPGQRRNRPHLHVIIGPDGDAETEHGVRVPPSTVERLLCDARVNTVRFSDGQVLHYGRERRTTSDAQFQALVVRDRHCRFPGCERRAHWCDAHHAQPWEHGGTTDIDNLVLLCNEHHHRVHEPGWHAKLLPDSTFEVTWPSGVTRSTRPPGDPAGQRF